MNVLLTGATGFLGGHILRGLSGKHRFVACGKNPDKLSQCQDLAAETLCLNLFDKDLERRIPEGIDLVCHAAGRLGGWGRSLTQQRRWHVEMTQNLLEAVKIRRIPKILYISSAGVLGRCNEESLDEDSPYHPQTSYEQAKYEAEVLLSEFCRRHHIRLCILRPEFLFGEHDRHLLNFFKTIRDRRFFFVGRGETKLQPTYVGDLVQVLDRVLDQEPFGGTYMVAGEHPVTVRQLINMMAGLMQVKPPTVSLPYSVAKAAALFNEFIAACFRCDPLWTVDRLDFFTQNKTFLITRAVEQLDYQPTPLRQGLHNTIDWYQRHGYL